MTLNPQLNRFAQVVTKLFEVPAASAAALILIGLCGFWIWNKRNVPAFNLLVAGMTLLYLLGSGEDTLHHAHRALVMEDQLGGEGADLLVNVGENELPIFYFYSTLIYTLAAPLVVWGMGAVNAVNLVGAVFLVVTAYGVRELIRHLFDGRADAENVASFYAILFISANYVYLNFIGRSAVPEAAAYSLVAWIVLRLLRGQYVTATLLLALQIALHPPMFIQAFAAEIVLLAALSTRVHRVAFRILACYVGALALSIPTWFPAFLNRMVIEGVDGLPLSFGESFITIKQLLNPVFPLSIGPYLGIFVFFSILVRVREADWRFRFLALAFALTILIQIDLLSPIVSQIPLLGTSLFVWRWMFVSALFGVIIASRLGCLPMDKGLLRTVVMLAIAQALLSGATPVRDGRHKDPHVRNLYASNSGRGNWGTGEFMPSYRLLRERCDILLESATRRLSVGELLAGGARADGALAVRNAPHGIIAYHVAGESTTLAACGDYLILSPRGTGGVVEIQGDFWMRNPWIKLANGLLLLALSGISLINLLLRKNARRLAG